MEVVIPGCAGRSVILNHLCQCVVSSPGTALLAVLNDASSAVASLPSTDGSADLNHTLNSIKLQTHK